MHLYKFKPATQLLHLLDIAIHERLFCQQYSELNDPFEGQFRTLSAQALVMHPSGTFWMPLKDAKGWPIAETERRMQYLGIEKLPVIGATRVCSLSSDYQDVRMWSLYADSHQGVVIEIDFTGIEDQARQVRYLDDLPKSGMTILAGASTEEVLSCKTKHWEYEKEYRILGKSPYFEIPNKISRVILGIRAKPELEELLKKILRPEVTIVRAELDYEATRVRSGRIVRQAAASIADDG